MSYSKVIESTTLATYLKLFAQEVDKGIYEKLNYRLWRNLDSMSKNTLPIHVSWGEGGIRIANDCSPSVLLPWGDDSFADFLWEHYAEPTQIYLDSIKNTNETAGKPAHNEKESENMLKFNFDFGPVNGDIVRMSMYGMAVKNKEGTFVSYDAKSGEIMDVDVFNFNGANMLYKMPVAMKDIMVGDVVIHQHAPMFVTEIPASGKGLIVVDVINGERKEIMLAKSPFGFNFATKVVNFLGNAFNGVADNDNPFGNMWMFMAMANEGGNFSMENMLPYMLMANGGFDIANMNPGMAMAMAMCMGKGDGDMKDILPFMFMFNGNGFGFGDTTKTEHKCGNCGNCNGNCHAEVAAMTTTIE